MALYGLIGKSLKHSFSADYFKEKFSREGIEADYKNFELDDILQFPDLLKSHPELQGLNVTIPYKSSILPFLDKMNPKAEEIGAVNTVRIINGKTEGYNTDVIGFTASIKPFLAYGMDRALILGTGGASKAIAYSLQNIGLEVLFVSRNETGPNIVSYADLNTQAMRAFKLIVNTTPLGTFPEVHKYPALPYADIGPEHLLYDLIYNPPETEFLKLGKMQGATTINGLSMLKIQAEKSWEIWNSIRSKN